MFNHGTVDTINFAGRLVLLFLRHTELPWCTRLLDDVRCFGIGGIVALGHHAQGADAVRIVLPRQLHHLKKGE